MATWGGPRAPLHRGSGPTPSGAQARPCSLQKAPPPAHLGTPSAVTAGGLGGGGLRARRAGSPRGAAGSLFLCSRSDPVRTPSPPRPPVPVPVSSGSRRPHRSHLASHRGGHISVTGTVRDPTPAWLGPRFQTPSGHRAFRPSLHSICRTLIPAPRRWPSDCHRPAWAAVTWAEAGTRRGPQTGGRGPEQSLLPG